MFASPPPPHCCTRGFQACCTFPVEAVASPSSPPLAPPLVCPLPSWVVSGRAPSGPTRQQPLIQASPGLQTVRSDPSGSTLSPHGHILQMRKLTPANLVSVRFALLNLICSELFQRNFSVTSRGERKSPPHVSSRKLRTTLDGASSGLDQWKSLLLMLHLEIMPECNARIFIFKETKVAPGVVWTLGGCLKGGSFY